MRPPSGMRLEPEKRAGAGDRVPPSRTARGYRWAALPAIAVAMITVLLVLSTAAGAVTNPARSVASPLTPATSASASCYSLNASLCLSMMNSTEPDILPSVGSHDSSVEPNPTDTIGLYIESKYNLVWATAHGSGALSPISLNVTGILWNGVPYYSSNDSSVWHPPGTSWWGYGPTGQNATYPYWYTVNFTAKSSSGAPNFYPGMAITWWLYFVTNTSGVISHNTCPLNCPVQFHFTYGEAWPFSPYKGTPLYAGPGAALEDMSVSQWPLVPNFNDSVEVFVSTTPADLRTGATLGGGYLDASEYAPDGALLNAGTFTFQITVTHGVGAVETNITLPSAYAQSPSALVEYRVTAWDTNTYGPDQIVSPTFNYTVNGNGTFHAHSFVNDLALSGTPVAPHYANASAPVVPAGQPLHLDLASRDAGTAILAAEVVYSFAYGNLGENATSTIAMTRDNSTHFNVTIPGMPLNTTVTYTIVAWDFAQDKDTSPMYQYRTPLLSDTLLTVPTNSTFFLTYVYDDGTSTWVTGASLEVRGLSGYLHVSTSTLNGVAYPNETGRAFAPLFVPAGESYKIWINDSSFLPAGSLVSPSVEITITAQHAMNLDGVIAVGPNYEVAESGNAFYFWLNETAPSFAYSETTGGIGASTALIAAVGLGALALVTIPTFLWWREIRARRQSEERRITL